MFTASPRTNLVMFSLGKGYVLSRLRERVKAGPAFANDFSTGPMSLNACTRAALVLFDRVRGQRAELSEPVECFG